MQQRVRLTYAFSGTWPDQVRVHRWVDWQFLPVAGEKLLIGDVLWQVDTRAWVEAQGEVFVALMLKLLSGPRKATTEDELLAELLAEGWERARR